MGPSNFAAPALIALIPVVVSPYTPPSSPRLLQILLYSLDHATIAAVSHVSHMSCSTPRLSVLARRTMSIVGRLDIPSHPSFIPDTGTFLIRVDDTTPRGLSLTGHSLSTSLSFPHFFLHSVCSVDCLYLRPII